jgi:hypothetical protein
MDIPARIRRAVTIRRGSHAGNLIPVIYTPKWNRRFPRNNKTLSVTGAKRPEIIREKRLNGSSILNKNHGPTKKARMESPKIPYLTPLIGLVYRILFFLTTPFNLIRMSWKVPNGQSVEQ